MARMTRGRLPARVYWVRRLMVLGIAGLLVVGVAKMLGGSSDASSGDDAARTVAATSPSTGEAVPSTPAISDPSSPATRSARHHHRHHAADPVTPVAMPSGPCAASDVAITPSVPRPVAGRDITLVLDVSSLNAPACTWSLSSKTLAMRITSGNDLIWTTTQCARAIPTQDLVLRQSQPNRVRLSWDAQRSEPGCPARSQWALPGTYHLQVAALAGRPQSVTFLLTAPSPAEVTRTAHPHHRTGKKKHSKPD
jgi:hypothetical protein